MERSEIPALAVNAGIALRFIPAYAERKTLNAQRKMFQIKTYNAISPKGLTRFDAARYTVGPDVTAPEAVLLRSQKLHGGCSGWFWGMGR